MIKITEKENCCGCVACQSVCPTNAIIMKEDSQGFLYPKIDFSKCITCDQCDKVCPILNNKNFEFESKKIAYATRTKNAQTLFSSTSGGISYELAAEIINSGGVVFGACYTDDLAVRHSRINTIEELKKTQGSKYVQSDIADTYIEAKTLLDAGTIVYFTGAPCQIEGLITFLGKKYDNLITQDFICHGVPSQALWKKYIDENEFSNAVNIVFREKKNGWGGNSDFVVFFNNGQTKRIPYISNEFSYFFSQGHSLRPICFNCPFKSGYKASDFTVADLWGIDKILPEFENDRLGMSFLSIHTEKAKRLFAAIFDKIEKYEISYENAIQENMMALLSMKKPKEYDDFWKDSSKYSFKKLYRKYKKRDPFILFLKKKIYYFTKSLFKK